MFTVGNRVPPFDTAHVAVLAIGQTEGSHTQMIRGLKGEIETFDGRQS